MLRLSRFFQLLFLCSVLSVQVFIYATGGVGEVAAQSFTEPLRPDANATQTLPKYSGVDQSISEYLCTPTGQGSDLYMCIGKLYRFGIAAGAILLVFFIVLAGYEYITGGETGKGKAKGMIMNSLTGMGILLFSYVLLRFINPALVEIRPIQPPIFSDLNLPKCEEIGFAANCIIRDGANSGQVYTAGVATSELEKKYAAIIDKYAQKYNLEYCALSAKVRQESSFIYNNVSNGPPNSVDPNHSDQKFFGLPFTRGYTATAPKGHGIGLNQVFIYGPPGSWKSNGWPDAGTPARPGKDFGYSKPLTVKDLIDPETSMNAGAFYFSSLMKRSNNNLYEAYKLYTGGHEGSALRRMTGFYDECKKASRS